MCIKHSTNLPLIPSLSRKERGWDGSELVTRGAGFTGDVRTGSNRVLRADSNSLRSPIPPGVGVENARKLSNVARLHEYQGKALLAKGGVEIPRGRVIHSSAEAVSAFEELGGPAVLKIQAWTTGRKSLGGVTFTDSARKAKSEARRLLSMVIGEFPVEEVLVEERLSIVDELFVSLSIDDSARAPVLLLSLAGGSGVEERAAEVARLPVDVDSGVDRARVEAVLAGSSIEKSFHAGLADAIESAVRMARKTEARSLEINPLVTTEDGRIVAADCRMTIDDYAVFRHPELGIEIARELDHPPTKLEKIAYRIEQADHRGTFYFARLPVSSGDRVIGFHGAGGGGSMMSMDAVSRAGFTPANFTDTSGNPSAAKVYAAARIILSQDGLLGYFGSGSGVASQEQYHSAYGLAKAFREIGLSIPALIRLGGNSEERAVEILEDACQELPGAVEGYKKDHTPGFIAERFGVLVDEAKGEVWTARARSVPAYVGSPAAMSFPVRFGEGWNGRVWLDTKSGSREAAERLEAVAPGLFAVENGAVELIVTEDELRAKDSELIAAEIELARAGSPILFVDIPIPGLDDLGGESR